MNEADTLIKQLDKSEDLRTLAKIFDLGVILVAIVAMCMVSAYGVASMNGAL